MPNFFFFVPGIVDLISIVSFLWYLYLLQAWTTVLLFKKNIRGEFETKLQNSMV